MTRDDRLLRVPVRRVTSSKARAEGPSEGCARAMPPICCAMPPLCKRDPEALFRDANSFRATLFFNRSDFSRSFSTIVRPNIDSRSGLSFASACRRAESRPSSCLEHQFSHFVNVCLDKIFWGCRFFWCPIFFWRWLLVKSSFKNQQPKMPGAFYIS